jgi:serine phosphatase RsbU (regulator of sigma subunit)
VLDILAEAVTIRDAEGTIAYANRAALASMGFETIEAMQARSSRSIMSDYMIEDEHGEPLSLEDVPSVRMMQGDAVNSLLMRTVARGTGEISWRLLKTAPLLGDGGELVAAVTVIEDVTAVKMAEMRMRLLAESGRILASSLDYQETLHNVAEVAVPLLADWCAVDLLDDDLRRIHGVVAHEDPAKLALADQLRALDSGEVEPDSATAQVVRTGKAMLFAEITDDQIAESARDAEHLRLLRAVGMRSALVVPMRVPMRTIGVMTLVTAESHRRLGPDDVELAEQLARRAAVAVENARLHTTLTTVAETLQRSLLPDTLPEIPGWEVASLYRPAGGGQRIDVGGDFYELFPSPQGWCAVIGDVTGKGVAAAALTGLLRHGSRFASRHDPSPGAILRELDEALRSRDGRSLCTALCIRLHPDHVLVSSGGHPPALKVTGDGSVEETRDSGPLLGAFDDGDWPEERLAIDPQALLLLYTDGVTETAGSSERFGLSRLKAVMAEHAGATPEELLAGLDAALSAFGAGRHADDVAALALRRSPER